MAWQMVCDECKSTEDVFLVRLRLERGRKEIRQVKVGYFCKKCIKKKFEVDIQ